jgi:predicted lipoprotein with Yx(FWY)xxD motif
VALIIIVVAILAGVAWWWHGRTAVPAVPAEMGQAAATPVGTMYVPDNLLLGTDATTTAGTYLIGSNGMTLYTYANDAEDVSNCTGQCAENWPPYLVPDASVLDRTEMGVTETVGTITRADGGLQVTYGGKPLYFYKGDTMSGDVNGQGVGGVWYLVPASSSPAMAQ